MDFTTGPWQPLSDRVFLARCEPARVNIGLIVGDAHAMLIDAGSCPAQGRELAATAAKLAGRPIDYLAITHWHWDHWFGAAGVSAATVIGHESLAALRQDAQVLAVADELGTAPDALVAPTDPMTLAKAVDLGGIRVEILHLGAAHTGTDLMVLVPDENIIFTGDLLEEGADPQFGDDSQVSTWPSVLDGVLGAATDDTRFVPGHGAVVDRAFAFRQRAELSWLYSEAERLARQGVSMAEAVEAGEWPFGAETVASGLPIVYAELARKGVRPERRLPLA